MSEDDGEDSAPIANKPRCPRCGGVAAPRRLPTAANPFLPKKRHLTCIDCGLDYGLDGKPVRP